MKKYLHPILFTVLFLLSFAICGSALELETPEAIRETEETAAARLSDVPAGFDLVFSDDFSSYADLTPVVFPQSSSNMSSAGYGTRIAMPLSIIGENWTSYADKFNYIPGEGTCDVRVRTTPFDSGSNNAMHVEAWYYASQYNGFRIDGYTLNGNYRHDYRTDADYPHGAMTDMNITETGDYMLEFDYYAPSILGNMARQTWRNGRANTVSSIVVRVQYTDGTTSDTTTVINDGNRDNWYTVSKSFSITAEKPLKLISFFAGKPKANGDTDVGEYYIDNVRLYAVNNKVHFGSSEYTVDDGPFTVPTSASVNFRAWSDGSQLLMPGDVIASGLTLAGRIFTEICLETALFDPAYGDLVFLYDYEGVTTNAAIFVNPNYASGVTPAGQGGSSAFITENGNGVRKFTKYNGNTYYMIGAFIPYNAATIGSRMTVKWDFKFGTDTYVGKTHRVRMLNGTNDNPSDSYAPSDYSGSDYPYNEWHTKIVSMTDTGSKGWRGSLLQYNSLPSNESVIEYIDNYAMYIYPAGTFAIKASEDAAAAEKITCGGATYTFESGIWTDGVDTYESGVAYAVEALQFKTFWPKPPVPVTLNLASMRTSTPQGVRIAGFVTNALRETADEYGFIVALASNYESDPTAMTMVDDGFAKVFGAAYVKGEKDIFYIDAGTSTVEAKAKFGSSALDEYGYYFTGVLQTFPESVSAYTAQLVFRTYLKIGDSYYYGEPVVKSLYQVAKAVAAKCETAGQPVPAYASDVIALVEG